ncbi:hypothetical protein X743_13215 [Mesorhizobium sp. LNHC252B00]|nr:hypothetical protein X743_13215 [Mesorhizobium sp. LNHC252B00]
MKLAKPESSHSASTTVAKLVGISAVIVELAAKSGQIAPRN